MNLHQVASGVIAAVNPFQPVTIQASTGYATAAGGKRTPTYAPAVNASGQVQDLTGKDLRQLEGLNISGSQRTIYLNGIVSGVVRMSQRGGDLITLADGTVWLTTQVLEQWDTVNGTLGPTGWCKVSVTLQQPGG